MVYIIHKIPIIFMKGHLNALCEILYKIVCVSTVLEKYVFTILCHKYVTKEKKAS